MCDSRDSIDHLFFTCPFAGAVWTLVQYAFNIIPPLNVSNMFGIWLNGVDKNTKARIRVGACALVWSIWNCRNDIIFNKRTIVTVMQVIHTATHYMHEWAFLLPDAQRVFMDSGCSRLEMVARDIFNRGGLRLDRRLQDA